MMLVCCYCHKWKSIGRAYQGDEFTCPYCGRRIVLSLDDSYKQRGFDGSRITVYKSTPVTRNNSCKRFGRIRRWSWSRQLHGRKWGKWSEEALSWHRSVRKAVVHEIGDSGDKEAIELLVKLLDDYDEEIGQEAAGVLEVNFHWKPQTFEEQISYAIARRSWKDLVGMGDRAVEPLIERLSAKRHSRGIVKYFGQLLVKALRQLGDERATKPLIERLIAERYSLDIVKHFGQLWYIVKALGQLGDERAVKPLIEQLSAGRYSPCIAEALGQLGDERAIKPLVALLMDKSKFPDTTVASALEHLGWVPENEIQQCWFLVTTEKWSEVALKSSAAVEPLLATLTSSSNKEAIEALGEIGDASAVEPLLEYAIKHSHERSFVEEALRMIGPAGFEPLLATLERLDVQQKPHLSRFIDVLCELCEEKDLRVFNLLLGTLNWEKRPSLTVLSTLVRIGQEKAIEPLVSRLEFEHTSFRYTSSPASLGHMVSKCPIIDTLIQFGSTAVDALIKATQSKSYNARAHAVRLLGIIGDHRAVPALMALLMNKDWFDSRYDAAGALEKLGWEPENEKQAAWYMFYREWHKQWHKHGFATMMAAKNVLVFEPLITEVENYHTYTEEVVAAIKYLLEKEPLQISRKALFRVFALKNVYELVDKSNGDSDWIVREDIDCSQVRKLALEILNRRR